MQLVGVLIAQCCLAWISLWNCIGYGSFWITLFFQMTISNGWHVIEESFGTLIANLEDSLPQICWFSLGSSQIILRYIEKNCQIKTQQNSIFCRCTWVSGFKSVVIYTNTDTYQIRSTPSMHTSATPSLRSGKQLGVNKITFQKLEKNSVFKGLNAISQKCSRFFLVTSST